MEEIIKFLDLEKDIREREAAVDKSKFQVLETKKAGSTVYAVDGGCSTIIDGGTWSISKIKISIVSYKDGNRTSEKTDNFMLGIIRKKKELLWKLNPGVGGFSIIANSTPFEELANFSRSVLEWFRIKQVASRAEAGDIILRDGAFSSNEAFEKSIINDALDICRKRKIRLIGICKTSRVTKEDGRPFIGILNEFSSKELPDKKWVYQDNDLTVAKLHEKSGLCFRIESMEGENLPEIMSEISYYSSDPEFTGYPYPLLRADKTARVRDFERENENRKAKMLAKTLGKQFIDFDERTTITHNLLDKRAYK